MKKLLCLFLIVICSSCSSIQIKDHKYISDKDYLTLVSLLENPVMDKSLLEYMSVEEDVVIRVNSYCAYNRYAMTLSEKHVHFSHVIDTNTINKQSTLTGEITTFLDDINVSSLDHFSELILSSYEDMYHYSVKDFIPTALSLIEDENLEFLFETDKYNMNKYEITGNINNLNLDDETHNALLKVSNDYNDLYNIRNPKISIVFRTNLENEYFLSSFQFLINNTLITEIT